MENCGINMSGEREGYVVLDYKCCNHGDREASSRGNFDSSRDNLGHSKEKNGGNLVDIFNLLSILG